MIVSFNKTEIGHEVFPILDPTKYSISEIDNLHRLYHYISTVSEFYKINPNGRLFCAMYISARFHYITRQLATHFTPIHDHEFHFSYYVKRGFFEKHGKQRITGDTKDFFKGGHQTVYQLTEKGSSLVKDACDLAIFCHLIPTDKPLDTVGVHLNSREQVVYPPFNTNLVDHSERLLIREEIANIIDVAQIMKPYTHGLLYHIIYLAHVYGYVSRYTAVFFSDCDKKIFDNYYYRCVKTPYFKSIGYQGGNTINEKGVLVYGLTAEGEQCFQQCRKLGLYSPPSTFNPDYTLIY